ncbi:MAG: hypothetical protein IPP48_12955 [Chitinophagaceae bacterium]|nr:hypothetical protein [Chitinophagaceae bacterium]
MIVVNAYYFNSPLVGRQGGGEELCENTNGGENSGEAAYQRRRKHVTCEDPKERYYLV